jgi:anaerobic ribonucleoside-triphosphate reductase activating protein
MRLHALMECSLANGPGRRTVVWFQGCSLHCPSCWNIATHSRDSGTRTSSAELVSRVLEARSRYGIDGITLSGGEPVHQIDSVIKLLVLLRREAPDLSAGLFTGYTERELDHGQFETYTESNEISRKTSWRNLHQLLDFAVFGRFNQHQPSSEAMIGSRNQQLRLLSDRYAFHDFGEQTVEVTIGSDGLTQITGFPTLGVLN